ncbi:HAMP domain-containing histidine kinase [Patescibacteria group bacterium]|nr:MAG: HAMP domain-containing histidine kinase [Patescibacteria group bacterium]
MRDFIAYLSTFFKTFRKEYHLILSAFLLILIPAAVIFNTNYLIKNVKKDIDKEVLRLGSQMANIIGRAIRDDLSNEGSIDSIIGDVALENPDIIGIDILLPAVEKNDIKFKIISSLDPEAKGKISSQTQNLWAWTDDEARAYLTSSVAISTENNQMPDENVRSWVIAVPFHDAFKSKLGLVNVKLSSQIIDERLAKNTFIRSYVMLAITLVIILILVAFNSRLFQYALLARRLKEVDQMKDEFISMASHELRAPITAVRGYLSMILDGSVGPISESSKKILEVVADSSKRLADLVEDLLEVSRIEQGRMKMTLAPVDVQEIISASIAELAVSAKEKGLEIKEQKWEGDLPKISADKDRMRQIIVNLLSNAIKYSLKGTVTITTLVNNGFIEIRVRDTGIGMSTEARTHLFEKFYRIKSDKTAKIPGTGLGLWITKQLIEIQKGSIRVDSIENVGTEMILQFPIIKKLSKG